MTARQGNALEKIIQYVVLGIVILVLTVLTFSINRSDTYAIEQRRIDDEQTARIDDNNLEATKCITEIKTNIKTQGEDIQEIKAGVKRMENKIDRLSNKQSLARDKAIEDFLAGGR